MRSLRSPAVGTDAAGNSQDFGTSRWRLSDDAISGNWHMKEALRSAIGTKRRIAF